MITSIETLQSKLTKQLTQPVPCKNTKLKIIKISNFSAKTDLHAKP